MTFCETKGFQNIYAPLTNSVYMSIEKDCVANSFHSFQVMNHYQNNILWFVLFFCANTGGIIITTSDSCNYCCCTIYQPVIVVIIVAVLFINQ